MRKDNPHISKRRGGRKQTHRRFSLQAFHHKHRHHHSDHDPHDHEMSKTPEESTNSAEAVALAFESACANRCDGDTHEKENKPREQCTVTFKMGLKWLQSKYYVSFYKGYKKGRAHSTDDGIQVEIKNGSKVVSRCHSCNTPSNNWHGVSARKANDVLAYYLSARHTICQLSIQNCQHEKSLKMAERTFCSIVTPVNKY